MNSGTSSLPFVETKYCKQEGAHDCNSCISFSQVKD